MSARCVVAVAGMEGALASVIGGLVDCPVIAVPTSVGYGASFGGLSALLSMLNSCASGCSVVNIDNGFGAGFLASRINKWKDWRNTDMKTLTSSAIWGPPGICSWPPCTSCWRTSRAFWTP